MKSKFLALIISVSTLSSVALAHPIYRNSGDNRWLPRNEEVTADILCHFNNETMLRVTQSKEHGDGSAKVIETSVDYQGKICVKKEYPLNYDGYRLPKCVKYEVVPMKDSLYFTTRIFDSSDIFLIFPTVEKNKIPACN